MTIAITGATSMIGVATIKECINQKINVLAFTRKNSRNISRIPSSEYVKVLECDLGQMSSFDCDKINADVFMHIGWAETDKIGRNDVTKQLMNVHYTLDAVHLAKKIGCKKFIGAGSQAEYGTPNVVLKSDTSCNPLIAYGIAKYTAGKFSKLECEKLGIEYVWVRILSVYGTNDMPETLISQLIYNAKNNIPMEMSGCEQTWDYLFEDDAGRAFVAIAKKGVNGRIYNLGSGIGRKLRDFVQDVIDVVNLEYKPEYGKYSYSNFQPMLLQADLDDLKKDTDWDITFEFKEGIRKIINDK